MQSVSVILRTFNRAHILSRAIDSVVAQSYTHWELLVIDNFSSDNTLTLISKYTDKRIKFFQFANNGIIAKSINFALPLASFDYIAILDSDDWWHPDKLTLSVQALDSGSDFVYHGCILHRPNSSQYFSNTRIQRRALRSPVYHDLLINGNPIINSSVVLRKQLLLSTSGFNESTDIVGAEDFDTWLNISLLTDRFTRLPHPLVFYSWGNYNLSNQSLSLKHTKYILKKRLSSSVLPPPSWACFKLATSYLYHHRPFISIYFFLLMFLSSFYSFFSFLSLPRYIAHYFYRFFRFLPSFFS